MKKIISSFLFLFLILSNVAADNLDKLYLVGPGPEGSSWSNRVEMNKLSDGSFEFTKQFSVTGDDGFKFAKSSNTDDWDCIHPSDNVTLNRNTEYILTDDDTNDYKIKVETAGWYTIHVSADGTKMSTYPVYIYPVGDLCPHKWNIGVVTFTETSFASGKYKGTLEFTGTAEKSEFKFMCGLTWDYTHIGPTSDDSSVKDIHGVGQYSAKHWDSGDHKFWVLDEGKGTYNMMVDINNGKLFIVPNTSITVTAAISDSAKNMLTKDDKSIQLFWWNDIESGVIAMTESEGKWSAVVSDYHTPIKFLIYNGKFKDQNGVQTVDMTNNGAGYTDAICVMVLSKKTDDKLKCFHNKDCDVYKSIKVSAQITPAAKGRIGDKVYLHSWATEGSGIDPEDIEMTSVQGKENWYEATVQLIGSYYLLLHNGGYDPKTIDITNDSLGFSNDVNVDIRYAQTGLLPAEINSTGADFTPYNVTLKAQVTKEALSDMGNEVNCHAWIAGSSIAFDKDELTQTDGFYTCTISTLDPICFCYHGSGGWEHTTVDMTNDGAGYTADKCVNIISRTTKVGEADKMWCFHNDQCTIASATTTMNAYVDVDAGWEQMRFFSEGVGEQSQYYNWFTPELTKGEDGWYNYEYEGESSLTIAAASDVTWTKRIDNIVNVSGTKYYYISSEIKGGDGADKYYNKVVELSEKKTPITFTFRFSDVAKETWESKPVYLRYWMNYQEIGEAVACDHVFFKQLEADDNGIYSCTIFPVAPVKLTIQSCGEGYHGEKCEDGHWTNDLSDGYTTNKDFIIKDYNAGGHLLEVYSAEQMTVKLTPDGYATACWDKAWTTTDANVYAGKYVVGQGLELTQVEDGIVPANTGVILYNAAKGSQTITLVKTQSGSSFDYKENDLKGTVSLTDRNKSKTTYVLGYTLDDAQTMLYTYTAEQIPSYKAYLEISSSSAPQRMSMFMRETPTGMMNVNANANVNRKVILNGQLVIIRDGQMFNAQGASLK